MAIGIDDLDDEFNDSPVEGESGVQDSIQNTIPNNVEQSNEDTLIEDLLRSRGITDSSKINFQDDNGEITQVDWKSLSREEQFNILNQEQPSEVDDLDDDEIELLNSIRASKMSPREFLDHYSRQGIQNYINSSQVPNYRVDQIEDDVLYVTDLIAKLGDDNITDEELQTLLEKAKENPELYQKQIAALRSEYQNLEDQHYQQIQAAQQQQQQQQFNQFAQNIQQEIMQFNNIAGFDINMDQDDMQELYEFISGFDSAGVSIFGKVLNDPKSLVKMAWFALRGEDALEDINNYWINELKKVREYSYNKGLEDSKNITNNSKVQIRKSVPNQYIDDLDEI